MTEGRTDPALRACFIRVAWAMAIYLLLIVAVPFMIAAWQPTGAALWLIALLPAAPMSAIFWFYGRCFAELRDEYVRLLEIRKALIATGLVLTLATAWGFLEAYAKAPHIPLYFVALAWFACHAIGSAVSALIERRTA